MKKIRHTVRKAAPDAVETISYQMPAFKQNGRNLIYFAAWKEHIGLYPTPSGTMAFKKELAQYKVTKGSVQFPLNKPIPYALIGKIVKYKAKVEDKNKGIYRIYRCKNVLYSNG